jgi:hypothetical protein
MSVHVSVSVIVCDSEHFVFISASPVNALGLEAEVIHQMYCQHMHTDKVTQTQQDLTQISKSSPACTLENEKEGYLHLLLLLFCVLEFVLKKFFEVFGLPSGDV